MTDYQPSLTITQAREHLRVAEGSDSAPRRERHSQLAIAVAAVAQAEATERLVHALTRNTEAILASIGTPAVVETARTRKPRPAPIDEDAKIG